MTKPKKSGKDDVVYVNVPRGLLTSMASLIEGLYRGTSNSYVDYHDGLEEHPGNRKCLHIRRVRRFLEDVSKESKKSWEERIAEDIAKRGRDGVPSK